MRIAFISDIHGNVAALEAVLDDIAQMSVDAIVCAGDMVALGPRPLEVMDRLDAIRNLMTIQGNTERWMGLVREKPEGPWDEEAIARVAPALRWTMERIGDERLDDLLELGRAGTLKVPGHVIEIEHASPGSDWVGIHPDTPDLALASMFEGIEMGAFACGHTHVPIIRRAGGVLVINDGSVGYPYDGVPEPSWALLATLQDRLECVIHRVRYDRDAVRRDMEQTGMVWSEVMARRLDTARM